MIYTLTSNPAVDLNETCDGVASNTVVRTRDAVFTPNGKGLNVSFTLRHFGVETTILGFFAGFTGDYVVEGAEGQGVRVLPVHVGGITRVNLFLTCPEGEYKFVNAGAEVDDAAGKEMIELISGLDDLDCLAVSGSMPPGTSEDFMDRVVDAVVSRGAEFVLDLSSDLLARLARRGPLLIKPNDDELREVFGLEVTDDRSAEGAMGVLHGMGVKNVLLTMGDRGAYFSDGEGLWYARPNFGVRFLSSACAGDGTLGSFLATWYAQGMPVEEALKTCQAVGANVVECPGLGDFGHVDEYRRRIEVRRVR